MCLLGDLAATRPLRGPTKRWPDEKGGPAYGGKADEAPLPGDWKLLQSDSYRPLQRYNLKKAPRKSMIFQLPAENPGKRLSRPCTPTFGGPPRRWSVIGHG